MKHAVFSLTGPPLIGTYSTRYVGSHNVLFLHLGYMKAAMVWLQSMLLVRKSSM